MEVNYYFRVHSWQAKEQASEAPISEWNYIIRLLTNM